MDETMKLINMAHEGDKAARDQLVMDNVGLIWSIVRRFSGRGYEMEDLFQIGSIGLLNSNDNLCGIKIYCCAIALNYFHNLSASFLVKIKVINQYLRIITKSKNP